MQAITAPLGWMLGRQVTMAKYQKLLPAYTSTPFMERIETLNEPIEEYESKVLRDLHNPQNIPTKFLPVLAMALSVDHWRADWSETQKRKVCASSVSVHRKKGTLQGVVEALEALSMDCRITEWHQLPDGELEPYRFRIDAEITESGLTAQDISDLYLTLEESKRLTAWLDDLKIWLKSKGIFFIAAATQMGEHIQILPFIQTNIEQSSFNPFSAMIMQDLETLTIYPSGAV